MKRKMPLREKTDLISNQIVNICWKDNVVYSKNKQLLSIFRRTISQIQIFFFTKLISISMLIFSKSFWRSWKSNTQTDINNFIRRIQWKIGHPLAIFKLDNFSLSEQKILQDYIKSNIDNSQSISCDILFLVVPFSS